MFVRNHHKVFRGFIYDSWASIVSSQYFRGSQIRWGPVLEMCANAHVIPDVLRFPSTTIEADWQDTFPSSDLP